MIRKFHRVPLRPCKQRRGTRAVPFAGKTQYAWQLGANNSLGACSATGIQFRAATLSGTRRFQSLSILGVAARATIQFSPRRHFATPADKTARLIEIMRAARISAARASRLQLHTTAGISCYADMRIFANLAESMRSQKCAKLLDVRTSNAFNFKVSEA